MMLDPTTIDHGGYWVFPFNSVEYYETYDLALAYVGAGPIVVAKSDGSVRFLHGSRPFEELL
jgi:immunity protein 35 of polymorphic toxin system